MEHTEFDTKDIDLTPHVIPIPHLGAVCKYRQGPDCCKYVVFFDRVRDFCCAKKIVEMKDKIDSLSDQMKAQGDNCEGLPSEKK